MRRGEPSAEEVEAVRKISWMDVYNCLPKINCRECGYKVCSAFAVNLFQGETKLSKCSLLKKKEYGGDIRELERKMGRRMLRALGWE